MVSLIPETTCEHSSSSAHTFPSANIRRCETRAGIRRCPESRALGGRLVTRWSLVLASHPWMEILETSHVVLPTFHSLTYLSPLSILLRSGFVRALPAAPLPQVGAGCHTSSIRLILVPDARKLEGMRQTNLCATGAWQFVTCL